MTKTKAVEKKNSPKIEKLCQTRKILQTADALLTKDSWIKGRFRTQWNVKTGHHEKMCAVGAVQEAARIELKIPISLFAERRALTFLAKAIPPGCGSIIGYNDGAAGNVTSVKRVFKKAIKAVEKKIVEAAQ